jgi:hypothetical protein
MKMTTLKTDYIEARANSLALKLWDIQWAELKWITEEFKNLINWLLSGEQIEFDFINNKKK